MMRALLLSLSLVATQAFADDEVFTTDAGAIRGYDAVSYHTEGAPVLGDAAITHQWNGVTWRFASESNRDLFAADPEKYAPKYGGFCAYGTSRGYKVGTEPDAFTIVNGTLYLNYNLAVQDTWRKDIPVYIERADTNWKTLEHQAYERP